MQILNPEIIPKETSIEIRFHLFPKEVEQAAKTPYLTTGEIAKKTGYTRQQINHLAKDIPGAYQLEETKLWVFPYTAMFLLATRRDNSEQAQRRIKEKSRQKS